MELNQMMKEIRQRGFEKFKGRSKAIAWREKDYLRGGEAEAGVVILPTKGCRWGRASGCTMCGYVYDAAQEIGQEEILRELEAALEKLQGVSYLKIFTSGSFLDEQEIERETAKRIFSMINQKDIKRVQIESRPEFVGAQRLKELKQGFNPELEIGIGLESTNDEIRASCINKGFSLEDFKKAVATCKSQGVLVKAYLLVKPPFLTEAEAIQDAIKSGAEAARLGADRISYNPMNVQRGTLVEELWKRGEYSTPWLWSVIEVLRSVKKQVSVPVLSHPIAAKCKRGAHNCGACDTLAYEKIIKFSSTQDLSFLDGLDCGCRKRYEAQLALEQFSH